MLFDTINDDMGLIGVSLGLQDRDVVDGLPISVDKLSFAPCIPADWASFKVHYRYRETVYHISVLQTRGGNGETSVTLDSVERPDGAIPLVDDRQEHSVEVRIAAPHSAGNL